MGNTSSGDLRPEILEDRVARAMEAARRRSGLTVDAMVKELRPALRLTDVSDKPVRWTWYGWRRNPRSIPAVALLAAAGLANTTVDALLSETIQPSSEGRLARLERQVEEQERLIVEMRRLISARTPGTGSGEGAGGAIG